MSNAEQPDSQPDDGASSPPPGASPARDHLRRGDRVRLAIHDLAFGGEGVGRWQNFVVFVPFVLPGEEVEVELTDVKKQFGRARLLTVLRPSPERITARCRYFGECGGCQYQHVDYPAQLRLKHRQVTELLRRVGRFSDPVVAPVIPCPVPYGYRNRIMVRTQWHKPEQRVVTGFLRHDNRLVVDIEECALAEPVLNEQLRQLRHEPPPRGGLKVVIREAMEGWIVPHDAFFQNNRYLLPRLVDTVAACLDEAGVTRMIDAYCGVGFFSLALAPRLEAFAGIELDPQAVRAARANAAARGCAGGEFVAASVEAALPTLLTRFGAAQTAVLLDPPRRGCHPAALSYLREVRPAQVLYVSCHPATLARDLAVLCAEGVYRLARVVPLDMFPQTQHVECVAELRPGEAAC
jgi:tRNA/tmRNA/rRNA uracil-C5-methylase (TrmA/RlmC/RlmD family)